MNLATFDTQNATPNDGSTPWWAAGSEMHASVHK